MNIQTYLDRIGYTGSREISRENLTTLIRQHLETVPFENLDCCGKGAPLSNEPEHLYEKIVTNRRGGICFELNGLLYSLLQAMGYTCYSVAVRIPRPDGKSPISHQGVVVTLDGKQYYCDVGFGGPGPKGALALDEAPEQTVDGERFLVTRDGIYVSISRYYQDTWVETLRYADIPYGWEDFTGMLYHFAMAPDSYFVVQRLVNLCLPGGGSLALTNNRFTARRNGTVTQTELASEDEVIKVLREEFSLFL
ncbi:MAG: arylamine N-acetyltransferase [Oscillospiraceae bacterium]|nr:arylamine N-acetyltransferase [Oscillospiraceae bacterium]